MRCDAASADRAAQRRLRRLLMRGQVTQAQAPWQGLALGEAGELSEAQEHKEHALL